MSVTVAEVREAAREAARAAAHAEGVLIDEVNKIDNTWLKKVLLGYLVAAANERDVRDKYERACGLSPIY